MSLIADALKAAQKAKEGGTAARQATVRPMLDGFFSAQRWEQRKARRRILVVGAVSVLVVAASLFGFIARDPDLGGPDAAPGVQADAAIESAGGAGPGALAAAPVDSLGAEVAAPEPGVTPPAGNEEVTEPRGRDRGAAAEGAGTRQAAAPQQAAQTPAPEPRATAPAREPAVPPPSGRTVGSGVQMKMERAAGGNYAELFAAALAAQNRGDLRQAADLYEQLLLLRPEWAQVHSNLGAVYRSLGDAARAERSFRRAIDLDADLAPAWSNLGMLLSASGRHAEAISSLQQALVLTPTAAATRVNLATALHASGSPAEARLHLEQVITAAPTMAEAHYALARVLETLREPTRALQHYELFLTHAAGRFPALETQVRAHVKTLPGGKG